MAIALVGTPTSAAGASTTSTTVSVTVPSGSTGDLLLICVAVSKNATNNADTPNITSSSALPTPLTAQHTVYCHSQLFYRFVTAGDPTSYTFTINTGSPLAVTCVRYSGVDSTTPFRNWNSVGNLEQATGATSSVTFPVVDNVQSTDLVVAAVAMGRNSKGTSITTIPTPSGWTSRISRTGPTSASSFPVTMGTFDTLAGTDTPTVSGDAGMWVCHSVVLVDSSNRVPDAVGGAITFVNASTTVSTSSGTTSLAVNAPSGTSDGDLLLLAAAQSYGSATFTPPAGWQSIEMGNAEYSAGTASVVSDVAAQLWYKLAASEPASYTVTCGANSQEYVLAVVAYRGVRNPAPISLHGKTTSTAAASTTSVAPYALPQINADNLVVCFYVTGPDSTGTITVTGPSSPWTQRAQAQSAVADFNPVITVTDKLAAADQPTATASRASTWTIFSTILVGAPAPFLPWKPRLGPNYRR